MADGSAGYFAGGLAEALSRIPKDVIAMRQLQSEDKYRQGMLGVAQSKANLEKNAALIKQGNDQIDQLLKSATQVRDNLVASGIDLQSPQAVKVLAPIASAAVQTAKLMEANGYSPGILNNTIQNFQGLLSKPSAVTAATTAGTAEGTKAATAASTISEDTGIPVGNVQKARGLDLTAAQAKPPVPSMNEIIVPIVAKAHALGAASLTDNDWTALDLAQKQSTLDQYTNKMLRDILLQKADTEKVKQKFDADQSKPAGATLGKKVTEGKYAGQYQVLDPNGNTIGYYQ